MHFVNAFGRPVLSPHRLPNKTLLVMKLMILLTLVGTLQASAGALGQKITLSKKDAPLETIFREIEKQTGYDFLYNAAWLHETHTVSLDVKDFPLENVLELCFKDQPFTYAIANNTIVIRQKPPIPKTIEGDPPANEIHGRLTNIHGEPLANANIIIKRTKTGAQTNANGEFMLKNVRPDDVLSVSFIGYKSLAIKVADKKQFTLVMDVTDNDLDKVVIQAYGTTSQRLATGNIATVTAAEIERQPVMNPLLALQGKVAGLDVNQTSGYASAPIKVELRGRSAISDNFVSDPLYIIDGVPLTVLELGGGSSYQTGSAGFLQSGYGGPANGQSPLFSLNPADIESITVLKDADATAIYGSRGANGVILITSKKGKAGNTKFDLHLQEGIGKVTKYWKMMNTGQYLNMRRQALSNDGLTSSVSNGDYDLLQFDTTKNTDWQRALLGGSGKNIDVQGSLSGGDAFNVFRIGVGYGHTTNILTVSGADQRASLSFNLSHHSLGQRFSAALTTGYSYSQSDMINVPAVFTLPPNAPAIFDSAGNLNYEGWGAANSTTRNNFPFSNLAQPYTSKTILLNSNIILSYQVTRGLRVSTSFGYNYTQANDKSLNLIASQDPLSNPAGSNHFGYNNNKNWIVEPQVTYDVLIGQGKLSVLGGGSLQETATDGIFISAYGYTSDLLIGSISNGLTPSTQENYGEYRYAALFGRLTYDWSNKYVLNLNVRRDGSSRFGAGSQYGNFGSVGAAWIFSEEEWIKNNLPFLSFGKVRASYGTTGSDAVGDYQYLTRWSNNNSSGMPYDGIQPLQPQQHVNPNYRWQVNRKTEGGINLGFLKDRIGLNMVYYRDRCGNQLISLPTPALSGFLNVTANSPALVQNDGWEFVVSAKLIDNKQFKFSVNFNTAINRNKLIAYPNLAQSIYAGTLVIGQPLNLVHLLHYTGVNSQTGEYAFQDKNHDGQITFNPNQQSPSSPGDDSYIYNLNPKYFGGLGMDFSYHSFQLSLFFYIKKQIGRNAFANTGIPGNAGINQSIEILGHQWQRPGVIDTYAKFSTQSSSGFQNFANSDGIYTDASFIRLSNLALSYNVSSSHLKGIGVKGCSVFIHANNLFVITRYKGIDPEIQSFGGMPPTRFIVGGLSLNF